LQTDFTLEAAATMRRAMMPTNLPVGPSRAVRIAYRLARFCDSERISNADDAETEKKRHDTIRLSVINMIGWSFGKLFLHEFLLFLVVFFRPCDLRDSEMSHFLCQLLHVSNGNERS
jgi:hypothetical protein